MADTLKVIDELGNAWEKPVRLDLGPGPWKRQGYIGIDCRNVWEGQQLPDGKLKVDAEIIYDLNEGIPFPDSSVDALNASHFMEHVANIYKMLDECHRVLKSNGELNIVVPLNEVLTVDHITSFYADWFERNLFHEGAYFKGMFKITYKDVRLKSLPNEHRAFWELQITLVALK